MTLIDNARKTRKGRPSTEWARGTGLVSASNMAFTKSCSYIRHKRLETARLR